MDLERAEEMEKLICKKTFQQLVTKHLKGLNIIYVSIIIVIKYVIMKW